MRKMKKIRDRLHEWYGKHTPSVVLPLMAIILFFCMVPLILEGRLLAGTSRQNQIDRRIIDVQNQCQILSNSMSRGGYLSGTVMEQSAIDAELSMLADVFNGRILIVNSGFRIVTDTFSLSEGKICISEEVIRCFQGENTNRTDTRDHYFVLTIPILDGAGADGNQGKTAGVMLVTASTESMLMQEEHLLEKAAFYQVIAFVFVLLLAFVVVRAAMRPFSGIVSALKKVEEGNLDLGQDVSEEAYMETKRISNAINQTLKRLRDMDKSRQEFVSNVSHELKTPITSIRVLADSLMSMEDAPKELYQEFMSDISDEIDRESHIIEDLLSLVRMDKTSPGINITSVRVNGLVESVLKRLRPIARKRNIELIFESIREVTADIDEVKFSLVITNLVENAIKYNKEDGWVKVTLDADHKFFYLKVADSGIGIPAELKDRVFERFYRVDKARSRETGGTGLGLAITKSVLQIHHGAIRVDSVEGEGSTFMVRIPLIYIN